MGVEEGSQLESQDKRDPKAHHPPVEGAQGGEPWRAGCVTAQGSQCQSLKNKEISKKTTQASSTESTIPVTHPQNGDAY